MRLTQKTIFGPTWEYEIVNWKLLIRQKSVLKSYETAIALQSIDPTPQSFSAMSVKWIVAAVALLVPVVLMIIETAKTGELGFLVIAALFLPLALLALYKFMSTKYDHVVFDHYDGNEKSTIRFRRGNPSASELEDFLARLKAEVNKIRYRDDLPDDKKLEIVLKHLEYLQSIEMLSDNESEALQLRAQKKYVANKVSSFKTAEANNRVQATRETRAPDA